MILQALRNIAVVVHVVADEDSKWHGFPTGVVDPIALRVTGVYIGPSAVHTIRTVHIARIFIFPRQCMTLSK